MHYQIIQPSGFLKSHIKYYWYMEIDALSAREQPQRLVPNGCMELTFQFADKLQVLGAKTKEDSVLLCGQKTTFSDIIPTGKLQMLSVLFYPHGSRMFFNLPMSELHNLSVPLDAIWGAEARELEEQMQELPILADKIMLLEARLIKHLLQQANPSVLRMEHNIRLINQQAANIQIDKLASEACLSRKQFERLFKEFIGVSPKQFLKTVRFQYSLYLQQHQMTENLTDLAIQSGYYDQAHMINDYKDLSGITPKKYFSDCDAMSDYF